MGNNTSVLDIYGDYRDYDFNYSMTSQDYFVHMLRFSLVADQIEGKNIFDIGCGKYVNLLKALCMMKRGPQYKCYVGTDYGKCVKWRPDYAPIWDKTLLLEEMDFTDSKDVDDIIETLHTVMGEEPFMITCFEVLEHMDFEMQNKFLYSLSRVMHEPGLNVECCMFSTPNHNGSPAKNHVSELSYLLLEEMFSRYGLAVCQAQGLSAWKKFHKQEFLAPGSNPPKYLEFMPSAIQKMVWGAALPRWYSNNILYNLMAAGPLGTYEQHRGQKFKFEEYRQGGDKQYMCEQVFGNQGGIR